MRTKHFAVIGRIHGQDEDSVYLLRCNTQAEAERQFREAIVADTGFTERQLREQHGLHKDDSVVYISHILSSHRKIERVMSYV
jgi:phage FluMu gp28-like protein